MIQWRLLDTGWLSAAENMALDQTLLEAKSKMDTPNTVRFLQFTPPAVLVGYNQCVEQEVRLDFCRSAGIDINRRITGGGAIFFDESHLGWEIICDKSFLDVGIANINFFKRACQPVVKGLREMGIDAEFRPRNDIEVEGRKISGTGGAEEGNAFLFQGTLLIDLDVETMFRALRIPIEKLNDKEIESAKERVSCLKWIMDKVPDIKELKYRFKSQFEKEFGVELEEKGLTREEKALFGEKVGEFRAEEWINKIKLPDDSRHAVYSLYKAEGGLIRTTLVLGLRPNRIKTALITGDFFAYPKQTIYDLEAELKDIPADIAVVKRRVKDHFERSGTEIPGITETDFVQAVERALDKIEIAKLGIPLSMSNHIFTVKKSFKDIVEMEPMHLLLPYCSKSLECGYRHKRECTECGGCSIGPGYTLARENNMWVTTILSFEDLMVTLERFRSEGVGSYIGCCCEAFYLKHFEDFEDSGVPGILIDIDSTTCYDLGKEKDAYEGRFENQTDINVELLGRVLDIAL